MNAFESMHGRQSMRAAGSEKSSSSSGLSGSQQSEEEGSLVFTDGFKDSVEEPATEKSDEQSGPAMTDAVLRDSMETDETQIRELEESFVRKFSVVTGELDEWSKTLKKADEEALYDRLYGDIEKIGTRWNTLNDEPLAPGKKRDSTTEKLRILEVFDDLRLIVNTMPMKVQEAIMKAQGEKMTKEPNADLKVLVGSKKGETGVKIERRGDRAPAEMISDTLWRRELDDFLVDQPTGRETIDMLGKLIIDERQAFDRKISDRARAEKAFVSRRERARLWRMFSSPQVQEMIIEYLERYQSVPRRDGNKVFIAILRSLEESAIDKTKL